MKWIYENRRAYIRIKACQMMQVLFLLTIAIILLLGWQKKKPDNTLMVSVRLVIALLAFDVCAILCDFIMSIKFQRAFIGIRSIFSTISFTLGFMIQVDFYMDCAKADGKLVLDLTNDIVQLLMVTVGYIYQSYVIATVINIFMYAQILEMEANEKINRQV